MFQICCTPLACQSPVNNLPITCQSSVNHLSVNCYSPVNHPSISCQSLYQSPINHMSIIHHTLTNHPSITVSVTHHSHVREKWRKTADAMRIPFAILFKVLFFYFVMSLLQKLNKYLSLHPQACHDYLELAQVQGKRWERMLKYGHDQRLRLEEVVEQLAKQHESLEKQARRKQLAASVSHNNSKTEGIELNISGEWSVL